MDPIAQFCSVMGIQESARLIFGKKGEPHGIIIIEKGKY